MHREMIYDRSPLSIDDAREAIFIVMMLCKYAYLE